MSQSFCSALDNFLFVPCTYFPLLRQKNTFYSSCAGAKFSPESPAAFRPKRKAAPFRPVHLRPAAVRADSFHMAVSLSPCGRKKEQRILSNRILDVYTFFRLL